MQVESPDKLSLADEESRMTFQVGMVCSDGFVIASDSLVSYVTSAKDEPASVQSIRASKFLFSPKRKVACAYAGGPAAQPIARVIAEAVDEIPFVSDSGGVTWIAGLGKAAESVRLSSSLEEVLVCRVDTLDRLWLVSRPANHCATVIPFKGCVFTGDNASARFLGRYLYLSDIGVDQAKRLALLALGCAATEKPATVGPPFEVLALKGTQTEFPELESHDTADEDISVFTELLRTVFWQSLFPKTH